MDHDHLRFALYARTSTEENQSPRDSLGWQRARAEELVDAHGGEVLAVYHDVGQSRAVPWVRRPEAARLLSDIRSPHRSFDHVVAAEPARAFAGGDAYGVLPILTHWGVGFWLPETGGRYDPDSEAHGVILALFGEMSKAERNRLRIRVRTAMRRQATEGRWLGGRTPYGYRLVNVGPHPNPAKARAGLSIKQLEPHPDQAEVVARIFDLFTTGQSLRAIAIALNQSLVPAPTSTPTDHRHWHYTTIRALLGNETYVGRRPYGKTTRSELLYDQDSPALGYRTTQRPTPAQAVNGQVLALITEPTWAAAQQRFATTAPPRPGGQDQALGASVFLFSGRLWCGLCGRTMSGGRNGTRTLYRCRLRDRASHLIEDHPKTFSISEHRVLEAVTGALTRLVTDDSHFSQVRRQTATDQLDSTHAIDRVKAELDVLVVHQRRLVVAVEHGFDPALAARRSRQLARDIDQQRRTLHDLQGRQAADASLAQEVLADVRTHLQSLGPGLVVEKGLIDTLDLTAMVHRDGQGTNLTLTANRPRYQTDPLHKSGSVTWTIPVTKHPGSN